MTASLLKSPGLYKVFKPKLGDPFVSQNSIEDCASHFPGRILDCAYTICSYGQI